MNPKLLIILLYTVVLGLIVIYHFEAYFTLRQQGLANIEDLKKQMKAETHRLEKHSLKVSQNKRQSIKKLDEFNNLKILLLETNFSLSEIFKGW